MSGLHEALASVISKVGPRSAERKRVKTEYDQAQRDFVRAYKALQPTFDSIQPERPKLLTDISPKLVESDDRDPSLPQIETVVRGRIVATRTPADTIRIATQTEQTEHYTDPKLDTSSFICKKEIYGADVKTLNSFSLFYGSNSVEFDEGELDQTGLDVPVSTTPVIDTHHKATILQALASDLQFVINNTEHPINEDYL
ncbi:MAG: hypothetical protein Q8Q49_01025 [bacterium]|nr:hypothetical protein [bacterium]